MKTSSDGFRVLVVDESWHTILMLRTVMSSRGYQVRIASSEGSALHEFGHWLPHVVLAEHRPPDMDGLQLCRRLRAQSSVPILMLSEMSDEATKVAALDSGADDYVTKPFNIEELLARVRAAIRRSGVDNSEPESLRAGDFRIDFSARRVYVQEREVRLTRTEFELFCYLARHPRRVVRYQTLLEAIWGSAAGDQTVYLRVHMGQIRKKIEPDPSSPRYLLTEHSVGYRFDPAESVVVPDRVHFGAGETKTSPRSA
jgi:two-component system KDP operon response regulator KdpE